MRRLTPVAAAAAISALLLGACGSTAPSLEPPSNADLTQTQLLARMQSAINAESATSPSCTFKDAAHHSRKRPLLSRPSCQRQPSLRFHVWRVQL